jgi:hypothetical protein
MTHDPAESAQVPEPVPAGTAAERYEAPELIVLGSVEELTAGLNGEVGPSQTTTTAT